MFFTSLVLGSAIHCTKDKGEPPVQEPPPAAGFCDTITYAAHIQAIVNNECVRCHNSSLQSGGVVFESFSQFKQKAEQGRIKARVIDGTNGFMPPDKPGGLSAEQKELINCWLNTGMKP